MISLSDVTKLFAMSTGERIAEAISRRMQGQFEKDNAVELLNLQLSWSAEIVSEAAVVLLCLGQEIGVEITHCRALLSQLDNELEICELDQRARISEHIAETSSRLGFVLKTSGQLQTLLEKMGLNPERKEGDECNCPMCSTLEN